MEQPVNGKAAEDQVQAAVPADEALVKCAWDASHPVSTETGRWISRLLLSVARDEQRSKYITETWGFFPMMLCATDFNLMISQTNRGVFTEA